MPMLTPVNAAAMEAIKRRIALAVAKGICAGIGLVAVAGTIALAAMQLCAIAGMFSNEALSPAIFSADASLVSRGLAALALCMGAGIWDMSRAKGWRSDMAWSRPAHSIFSALSVPLGLMADRVCIKDGSCQGPHGHAASRKDDRCFFMPKPMSELNSSIRAALSAAPQVAMRLPLWSALALWTFLTFPLVLVANVFVTIEDALRDFVKNVPRRLAPSAQGVALEALCAKRKSLRALLSGKIEELAREAPEAFAKAEAEALSKTAAIEKKPSSSSRRV